VSFIARNHPQQVQARRSEVLRLFEEEGPENVTELVDDRATPPDLFGMFDARFRFTIDVCASEHNTKLPRFFDKKVDGLAASWAHERVWCNPPYSDIKPWVKKAWAETLAHLTVLLLPANRTEQGWWQNLVEPHRDRPGSILTTEFLRGRTRFIAPGASGIGPNERPPFGCVLLIWNRTPEGSRIDQPNVRGRGRP
jgi:phage N-6-adenine-methyltransferase